MKAIQMHTPGPWTVDPFLYSNGKVWGPDGQPVAVLEDRGGTLRHNANLISAAPDLLEALRTLTNTINAAGIPEWLSVVDFIDALAAVQKAEGREGEAVRL